MDRHSIALLCIALLGLSATIGRAAVGPVSVQDTLRTVYVSADDGKGVPVGDLAATDFTVKEDGKTCEVLKAERASGPVQVALLIDDNGLGANDIRNGVAGLIQRIQGQAEIALITTAGQNVTRVDFTSSVAALMGGVSQLYSRPAPRGGHLLDGIFEAARALEARKALRPVIIVVAFESEEFSNLRQDRVLDQLRRSGASLNVIAIGKPVARTMNPLTDGPASGSLDENFNLGKVLGDGPKQSGGRRQEMVVSAGVPKALQQIADDLSNQYLLTYRLPAGTKPSDKLGVTVTRRGATLRAPTRVPDR